MIPGWVAEPANPERGPNFVQQRHSIELNLTLRNKISEHAANSDKVWAASRLALSSLTGLSCSNLSLRKRSASSCSRSAAGSWPTICDARDKESRVTIVHVGGKQSDVSPKKRQGEEEQGAGGDQGGGGPARAASQWPQQVPSRPCSPLLPAGPALTSSAPLKTPSCDLQHLALRASPHALPQWRGRRGATSATPSHHPRAAAAAPPPRRWGQGEEEAEPAEAGPSMLQWRRRCRAQQRRRATARARRAARPCSPCSRAPP